MRAEFINCIFHGISECLPKRRRNRPVDWKTMPRMKDTVLCIRSKIDPEKTRRVCQGVGDACLMTMLLLCGLTCFSIVVQEANLPLAYRYPPPWRTAQRPEIRVLHAILCLMALTASFIRLSSLALERNFRLLFFSAVVIITTPFILIGCTMMFLGGHCLSFYPFSLLCRQVGFFYFSLILTGLLCTFSFAVVAVTVDLTRIYYNRKVARIAKYQVA